MKNLPLKNIALIVAAGSGARSGQHVPKQYVMLGGKAMICHSVSAFSDHPNIDATYIVIGNGQESIAAEALRGITFDGLIIGGDTRQNSVFNGLEYISNIISNANILIHDAARPYLRHDVIDRLLSALDHHSGVIPIMPMTDSLIILKNDVMASSLDRDNIGRVQTPQAFDLQLIYAAHKKARQFREHSYSDDAQIFQAVGHKVATVAGEAALHKYTFAEDFMNNSKQQFRIGSGYDVHRFAKDEQLWLGGIKIDSDIGLAGHSDADIVLHALTDALLGALSMGDIGDHFPPTDPQWKGASSDIFMKHACQLATENGYTISNADITIICEAPKIGPHRLKIRQSIADILCVDLDQISVKATTSEKLGFTGRGEGMAVQAQILIERSS